MTTAEETGKSAATGSTRVQARGAAAHFGIADAQLVLMYTQLVQARRIADRMVVLQRQGRAPFVISGQGQEACQIGAANALKRGTDWLFPYYRDLGMCLAFGMTPVELFMNFFAKQDDPNSHGVQMAAHWSRRASRIVSGSSPVATQLLHATGCALAAKLRKKKEVCLTSLGEGSTAQGDFHEALNFAAIHKLPVIFYVENNGYAISEPIWKQMAVPNVADRAPAYGMRGQVVDGNDLLAVYQTVKWAVGEARRGHGPALIEAKTYRIVPHSSDDDDRRYRTREELQSWMKRDPIDRFRKYLLDEAVLSEAKVQEIQETVDAQIAAAIREAEAAPDPAPEAALRHVYAEPGAR
ncbi:MAG TPA: thiamine pyrophosphate-dependent dehydrogenase E1 component subunit alpha [Dehalococcoidia bacterium]|nr:thiamine pyrophosphate-dependent dehydrogenase E1 component subunit alpha [Dehalococcoidia bacterium]